ncbi:hypothetical protein CSQ89_11470 [Chitinimonas sp. BJB300]|nr:hypothetical protein CSQ89_11470 [Chitinimonas sp. BJB300]TSJ88210.1 hypothetical protein FG002_011925 [Chitinimonas sp. BJB300]
MPNYAELSRRFESLIRSGTIIAIDHASALCRVKTGSLETEWEHFFARFYLQEGRLGVLKSVFQQPARSVLHCDKRFAGCLMKLVLGPF